MWLRPWKNGRHFVEDIFKFILLYGNFDVQRDGGQGRSQVMSRVECRYDAVQFITILSLELQTECKSDFVITTDTPYLTLTGELWGLYYEDLGENWLML